MGLGLSRNIRSLKQKILSIIKKNFKPLYFFLIFFSGLIKFIYKKNKKKNYKKYSSSIDEINKYEFKKTSQNNEDGIIDYILRKIDLKNINFVEIGFDYYENNSLNLIKKTEKGLYIDGSQEKCFLLKNILKFIHFNKNINITNSLVNIKNVNQLIKKYFSENEIDFLSIDVDGIDYYLLKELKFNPKVICIEYNFWFGKDLEASVPYSDNFVWKQGTVYSGASLSALNKLANSKGYYLIGIDTSCTNAFFIRSDFKDKFQILDPKSNFKTPLKYTDKEIEDARNYLLSTELKYFN